MVPVAAFTYRGVVERSLCPHCHDEARRAAYRAANPHVYWAGKYRQRCRMFGLPVIVEDFTKADVIATYGDRCAHCKTGAFEQLDHYPTPVVAGGEHTLANVRPSCRACNVVGSSRARAQRKRPATNSV